MIACAPGTSITFIYGSEAAAVVPGLIARERGHLALAGRSAGFAGPATGSQGMAAPQERTGTHPTDPFHTGIVDAGR